MSDRGAVTVWVLGFTLAVFFLGGLTVDIFRAFAFRQELAGLADSAAIAGATAVDVDRFRSSGEVVLDPSLAEGRALEHLSRQDGFDFDVEVWVTASESDVVVELGGTTELLLTKLLYPEDHLDIRVRARSLPVTLEP